MFRNNSEKLQNYPHDLCSDVAKSGQRAAPLQNLGNRANDESVRNVPIEIATPLSNYFGTAGLERLLARCECYKWFSHTRGRTLVSDGVVAALLGITEGSNYVKARLTMSQQDAFYTWLP